MDLRIHLEESYATPHKGSVFFYWEGSTAVFISPGEGIHEDLLGQGYFLQRGRLTDRWLFQNFGDKLRIPEGKWLVYRTPWGGLVVKPERLFVPTSHMLNGTLVNKGELQQFFEAMEPQPAPEPVASTSPTKVSSILEWVKHKAVGN